MLDQIQTLIAARRGEDAEFAANADGWLTRLRQIGLPKPRDEAWRYAPIRGAEQQVAAALSAAAQRDWNIATMNAALPARVPGFSRLILFDGVVSELSDDSVKQATTSSAPNNAGDDLGHNGFALISQLLSNSHVSMRLGEQFTTRLQIVSVTAATQPDRLTPIALHVAVESGAAAELIEHHLGLPGAACGTNLVADISVGTQSTLHWTRVLAPDAASRHIETLRINCAAESQTQLVQIVPGNNALRSTVVATLAGAGAHLDFDSVALGNGNQQVDQHVLIDHRAPAVKSRETFRGLAAGRARVSFTGHNRVQPAAVQTDTHQSLRSLLLSSGAEAIARPQLEILTDAVKASHGATIGTLDQQMLFYLLSRGLDRNMAQSLLKWAFLQEVVAKIPQRTVRSTVETELLARLDDSRLAAITP